MTKAFNATSGLAALSFGYIAATGVDRVWSRTGPGLLGLGILVAIIAILSAFRSSRGGLTWLILSSLAGCGYFAWRAYGVGPVGLATSELILIFSAVGAYFAMAASAQGGRRCWLVVIGLVLAANVGLAFAQAASSNGFTIWDNFSGKSSPVSGLFNHHNRLGAFLNGSVFFFLSFAFMGKHKFVKGLCGLLTIAAVVALFLSTSRGGWFGLFIGGVVWLVLVIARLYSQKSSKAGAVTILALGLVLVGGLGTFWGIKSMTIDRIERARGEEVVGEEPQIHDSGRFAFQQMAFELFQEEPLLGNGPRSFWHLSLERWDREMLWIGAAVPEFVHNEYLQVLCDYGIVGFCLIVILLFLHGVVGAFGFLSQAQEERELQLMQLGAIGGLVAILAQSYFSFVLHFPALIVLCALQLGLLASRPARKPENEKRPHRLGNLVTSGAAICFAMGLVFLGWEQTQAHLLQRKSEEQLAFAYDSAQVLKGLATMTESAKRGKDPAILEKQGRLAMSYAAEAASAGDFAEAREFNLSAKEAFEVALDINPHYPPAVAGLPRVLDALGEHDIAEIAHQSAMKKIWSREIRLRPHFHAARGSFLQAFQVSDENQRLALLGQSAERLARRREIYSGSVYQAEDRDFQKELQAWIAFYEARKLYRKGAEIWLKARPRNPELAYAILLEAHKRYRAAAPMKKHDPRWEIETTKLAENLKVLEAGQFIPVPLSEEELAKILSPEAGLDSDSPKR